jgi:hypothetical protein
MKAKENRLIAKFMGYSQPHPDYPTTTYWYKEGKAPLTILSYNTDWNWLMEVVDKIEYLSDGAYDVNILKNGTEIINYSEKNTIVNNVCDIDYEDKIEHTYSAVVEFINYYNAIK